MQIGKIENLDSTITNIKYIFTKEELKYIDDWAKEHQEKDSRYYPLEKSIITKLADYLKD